MAILEWISENSATIKLVVGGFFTTIVLIINLLIKKGEK